MKSAAFAVCAALLIAVAQADRDLKLIEIPTNAPVTETILYNNSYPDSKNKDIPIHLLNHTFTLNATGGEFSPDQVHITLWTPESMLFSWATGYGKENDTNNPPAAYDVNMVGSVVKIGTAANQLTTVVTGTNDGKTSKRLTYMYEFAANSGEMNGTGTVYQSPILHHVVVSGLTPGQQYFYQVGDNNYGFSKVYNFTLPKLSTSGYPFKIAVAADIGQTANASEMIHRLGASKPDIFLHEGDYSYSDDWLANGTSQFDRHPAWGPGPDYFTNWQQKWDAWMRMAQDVIASVPHNGIAGNHEIESQRLQNNITNMAYNARFPLPRDPSVINTSPNDVTQYWDQALLPQSGKFFPMSMTDSVVTNNTWYSIEAGPAHVVFLNNYVPYGNNSEMYKWFIKDMESVNRTRTPWVIVGFHAPWYHTYIPHYKENDEMRLYFEPAFFKYGVDAVFAGHVHAYERSPPVYQWQPNTCGPFYITIGDGGNIEGLYKEFVDQTTSVPGVNASIPKYCYNTSLWAPASYQPSYSGRGYIDPNTPFCFSSQPPWSDFRNPSFGYGMFTLINDTTARWQWNRNIDPVGVAVDDVYFKKNPTSTCNAKVVMGTELSANANAKGLVAPPASPGASPAAGTSPAAASPAPKSSASTASMVAAVLLACVAFLA